MEYQVAELTDWARYRKYGLYRGIVVDNEDPTSRGRLKVRVPAVLGDLEVWAMPCVPYAGDGVGFYAKLPLNSGCYVTFENGDISYPVVVGSFWADTQLPKSHEGTSGTPPLKIIRSERGMMLTMDDSSQTITLSDEKGNNMLTIEVNGGKITVKGASQVVLEAPSVHLVKNGASHPLVYGDELLSYLSQLVTTFQSHTHPGQMAIGVLPVTPAPPTPPFPPATPKLISKKAMTD